MPNDEVRPIRLSTCEEASSETLRWAELARSIRRWGREAGFSAVGISDALPSHAAGDVVARAAEERLQAWLANGYHGTMEYMARHGMRRARPAELVPGTLSVISVRIDYLPLAADEDETTPASDGGQPWIDASWRTLHKTDTKK